MPMKCYVGYTLCVSFIFDHIPTCLHISISQTSLWIYHIPDRAEANNLVGGAGEVTSLEWWKLEEMEILFLVILVYKWWFQIFLMFTPTKRKIPMLKPPTSYCVSVCHDLYFKYMYGPMVGGR